ncbi:probable glycosyltransferase STELLO1 [Nematostella vectensis]|uniref:probable glycosyltransferase STELLO1 n=1 Tax=Nematostella vectensis TaxID=45351 RepID=UPI0020778F7F|nr:probable glycosyltransferase STELLO1 [Nematostella vectensis]
MLDRKLFAILTSVIAGVVFYLLLSSRSLFHGNPKITQMHPQQLQQSRASNHDCYSYFDNVALIIVYHYPYYESFSLLHSFYENGFRKIIVCGPVANDKIEVMQVSHEKGYWGYECLAKAARLHPGYEGYLQIHDDALLFWWNVLGADKNKIWLFGNDMKFENAVLGGPTPTDWHWWRTANILNRTADVFNELRNSSLSWVNQSFSVFYNNTGGSDTIPRSRADGWYVPRRLSKKLSYLSSIFLKHKVFLETAVPTMMCFLDYLPNILSPGGLYLSTKYGYGSNRVSAMSVWKEYRRNMPFLHPFKLHGDSTGVNRNILIEMIIPHSQRICNKSSSVGKFQE